MSEGEKQYCDGLEAMRAAGYAVVPVVPTEAMQRAGMEAHLTNKSPSWMVAVSHAYTAMIQAADNETKDQTDG
jgi:predicted phosphoribosyltransferase